MNAAHNDVIAFMMHVNVGVIFCTFLFLKAEHWIHLAIGLITGSVGKYGMTRQTNAHSLLAMDLMYCTYSLTIEPELTTRKQSNLENQQYLFSIPDPSPSLNSSTYTLPLSVSIQ